MVIFKENRKFFEFAIGYIFMGIGQKLMGVGLLKPWSENAQVLLWLGLVGLSLFGIGLFFIRTLSSQVQQVH
ncbi:hypothetical protein E8L09_01880 [Streptococcus suis]|uniref:Uncharacterized protein n=1 Tax=Streptococcus suis TaxID=1307 RepID=A0A4T2H0X1_STRSU|nr:hypothetical protein [Streptococcus suis]MBO4113326.1 hypothetical protein [Streptococcus suis]TII05599.1 hypothetical protein E8L09_01880 [Streptococcus suis]